MSAKPISGLKGYILAPASISAIPGQERASTVGIFLPVRVP